jgi:anaerobic selenocysteine-containing dehydrogenase
MSGNTHICTLPKRLSYIYTFGSYGIDPYFDGMGGMADLDNAKVLIVWGSNPFHTNPSAKFFEAKERGMKIINIDPRYSHLGSISDEYVQIRPGTDGALALGMLNIIIREALYDESFCEKWTSGFDELKKYVMEYPPEVVERITWVDKAQIERITRMYAAGPSAIQVGVAVEQNTNAVQTCRAIDILMAVTGNYDVKGGNLEPMTRRPPTPQWLTLDNPKLDERRLCAKTYPLIGSVGANHTKILTEEIWDAILTGKPYPIKAMIVVDANPAVVFANPSYVRKALESLEFLVVVDPFNTETTELADIVLPASTTFEWTWYIAREGAISLRQKVIEPLWESRPETEIIFELGRIMSYREEFPWSSTREALEWELENFGGPTLKELEEQSPEELFKQYSELKFKYKKYEGRGFATPSGKVEIYSTVFKKHGYDPLPIYREPTLSPLSRPDLAEEYPLILTTGKQTPLYTHSMFRNIKQLNQFMPENLLEINPETARNLSIYDGEKVIVESPTGRIKIRAKLTKGIHPKVVGMRHGFADCNCNNLIDNFSRDPISGSTAMKASLCRVVKM